MLSPLLVETIFDDKVGIFAKDLKTWLKNSQILNFNVTYMLFVWGTFIILKNIQGICLFREVSLFGSLVYSIVLYCCKSIRKQKWQKMMEQINHFCFSSVVAQQGFCFYFAHLYHFSKSASFQHDYLYFLVDPLKQITVRWEDFKQNCKTIKWDLHRITFILQGFRICLVWNPRLNGIETAF